MKLGKKEIIKTILIVFILIPLMLKLSGREEFTNQYETNIEITHQIKYGSIRVYYKSENSRDPKKYGTYGLVHLGVNEQGIFVKPIWLLGALGEPALLFRWKSIDRCSHSYGDITLKMKNTNSTVILSDGEELLFRECNLNHIGSI
jgi:hypothetical protein